MRTASSAQITQLLVDWNQCAMGLSGVAKSREHRRLGLLLFAFQAMRRPNFRSNHPRCTDSRLLVLKTSPETVVRDGKGAKVWPLGEMSHHERRDGA